MKRSPKTPRTRRDRTPQNEKRNEAKAYGPANIVRIHKLVYQFNYAC
jgi:hypothetical protein